MSNVWPAGLHNATRKRSREGIGFVHQMMPPALFPTPRYSGESSRGCPAVGPASKDAFAALTTMVSVVGDLVDAPNAG